MSDFRAFRVHLGEDGEVRAGIERRSDASLPAHGVTVRVGWSSLNYKDALSARGHRGVTRSYPHTPGIDAAGIVEASDDATWSPGDRVFVTGHDLGMNTDGGFGERIRVPAAWLHACPEPWSLRDAMVFGTAGLTAGLALDALERWGANPNDGPALVTGATGGVGSLAVALLAAVGWTVHAVTGSPEHADWLQRLGASHIEPRDEYDAPTDRPMLAGTFAAAIDVAGGATLANVVKRLRRDGAAVACGLVQSPDLDLTVYPFILRGAALLGVDSAEVDDARRRRVWARLAEFERLPLDELVTEVALADLPGAIAAILAGRTRGRVVVRVDEDVATR